MKEVRVRGGYTMQLRNFEGSEYEPGHLQTVFGINDFQLKFHFEPSAKTGCLQYCEVNSMLSAKLLAWRMRAQEFNSLPV